MLTFQIYPLFAKVGAPKSSDFEMLAFQQHIKTYLSDFHTSVRVV